MVMKALGRMIKIWRWPMKVGDLVRWTKDLRREGQYFRSVGVILGFDDWDGDPIIYWRGNDCKTCEYKHQVELLSEDR